MAEPTELFPEVPNLYEFLSVHADMLYAGERVEKYSEAIRRTVKPGDVVADIGTGTGLLALLCLHAGASRVHAIERSSAIQWARMLAERNGLSERIVFHNADSRQVWLPEKADVIVSELIGHAAFEEDMIECVMDAKRRFLASSGSIIPRSVRLRVAPVAETEVYREWIDRWEPVQGLDLSVLRDHAARVCYVTHLPPRELLSEPRTFFEADFTEDTIPSLVGSRTFRIFRSGEVTGLGLWFEASLAPGVWLSSGPWTRTHWEQCFAPVPEPVRVSSGDQLRVSLDMRGDGCGGHHFIRREICKEG